MKVLRNLNKLNNNKNYGKQINNIHEKRTKKCKKNLIYQWEQAKNSDHVVIQHVVIKQNYY